MSDIHQQLPAGVSPASFDAYVDRLILQADQRLAGADAVLRAAGIAKTPVRDPATVAARRRDMEQMALTDITVGGVRL